MLKMVDYILSQSAKLHNGSGNSSDYTCVVSTQQSKLRQQHAAFPVRLKMGKRYYCDFCERSFADNAENRKKHLNGVQHQRQKKLHYDSFRDAATILADEMAKKPCKRFTQSGQCDFGDGCRFSHLTAADIHRLQEQVKCTNDANEGKLYLPTTPPGVEVQEWLTKRQERIAKKVDTASAAPRLKTSRVVWTLPSVLQTYPKLPPSVYPPCASDFYSDSLHHWG